MGGGFRVLGQGCVQCTAHWHGETAQHDDMEHCTAPLLYIKWYTGSECIRKQESFLSIVIMNSTGKKSENSLHSRVDPIVLFGFFGLTCLKIPTNRSALLCTLERARHDVLLRGMRSIHSDGCDSLVN